MFFSIFSENLIFNISDLSLGFDLDFKSALICTPMGTNKPVFPKKLTLSDFSMIYFLFYLVNGLFVGIICFRTPHFLRFPGTHMLKLFPCLSFFSVIAI